MRVSWGLLVLGLAFVGNIPALAEPLTAPLDAAQEQQKLELCLKKAVALPDIAFAEAEQWRKKNGGDRANMCWAFASFQRGEYDDAARMFLALAAARDTQDAAQAASLHAQAGLAYMRISDWASAEKQYGIALKQKPDDADIWVDRATTRGAAEKYWDAIDDLNKALKLRPRSPEIYRLRGQAWAKLGNAAKAESDFWQAGVIEGTIKPEAQTQSQSSNKTALPVSP